jgi:hypothetical protein
MVPMTDIIEIYLTIDADSCEFKASQVPANFTGLSQVASQQKQLSN